MIVKVLYSFLICYVFLRLYEVNLDSKHDSFNVQHFFGVFYIIKKNF